MKSDLFDYQKKLTAEVLTEFRRANRSDVVLAAACGGGKSIMALAICEELLRENPSLKILVLSHGQTILRTNFEDNIREHQPKFTYTIVDKLEKLNENVQVFVGLPHTIHKDKEHKFDVIIVDEAHQFYFAPDGMVQRIIKQSEPRFTLLLTGSPSRFIKEGYTLHSISLLELLEHNRICSPTIELAQTSYDYTYRNYNKNDELENVTFTSEQTKQTLDNLLGSVQKVLCSVTRTSPKLRSGLNIVGWSKTFGSIGKTMFTCRSQLQAGQVKEYFEATGINVALSTSDFDPDSSEIDRFKIDKDCMVLVVVDRGIRIL